MQFSTVIQNQNNTNVVQIPNELHMSRCCAHFRPLPDYYPPSIGRLRVRCGGGVRIRQSDSDFNERGNNLAGGRKWAQHRYHEHHRFNVMNSSKRQVSGMNLFDDSFTELNPSEQLLNQHLII